VISAFVDGSAMPMVCGIGGSALLTALLTWRTLGHGAKSR
jgi:DHA1 family bicyclomycin/chloramphenicol resistance-like MFS transporter